MDPATAIATATAAFTVLKKGFSVGRDIESMAGDVSRWMGALSDLDQAEKEAKNPPIIKKLVAAQSVEQEALQIFMAKRKAQKQRDELRTWMNFALGPNAWAELIKMEGQIRKQRQQEIYRQREIRRKIIEYITIFGLLCTGTILLLALIWWLKQSNS